jgi:hypothetical protein
MGTCGLLSRRLMVRFDFCFQPLERRLWARRWPVRGGRRQRDGVQDVRVVLCTEHLSERVTLGKLLIKDGWGFADRGVGLGDCLDDGEPGLVELGTRERGGREEELGVWCTCVGGCGRCVLAGGAGSGRGTRPARAGRRSANGDGREEQRLARDTSGCGHRASMESWGMRRREGWHCLSAMRGCMIPIEVPLDKTGGE